MATSSLLPIPTHKLPLYITGTTPITLRNNAEDTIVQTDASTVVVNLPALSHELNGVSLIFVAEGGGTMTVTAAGTDTIQGAATVTVNTANGTTLTLLANHTSGTWYKVSGGLTSVTAEALATTGAAVTVGTAAPPSTGQVLTATSATTAAWETPIAQGLATTGAPVIVSTAAPPTTGQALVATSATAADWATPQGSTLGYGQFYGNAPADYGSTIAVNAPVPYAHDSVSLGGVARNGNNTDFILPAIGTYDISWNLGISTAGGQLTLWLDPNTGTFAKVSNTSFGIPAAGTIIGKVGITTIAATSKIQIRNDTSAGALTVAANVGGTEPSANTLIISRLV